MTGHETVQKLREFEQTVTSAPTKVFHRDGVNGTEYFLCGSRDQIDLFAELRNSAGMLLSVAGAFQPGDYLRLRDANVALYHAGDERFSHMLARLQAAAERLEQ